MKLEVERIYVLKLTKEEYELLYSGIGNTSLASREEAGMEEKESRFFSTLFSQLEAV